VLLLLNDDAVVDGDAPGVRVGCLLPQICLHLVGVCYCWGKSTFCDRKVYILYGADKAFLPRHFFDAVANTGSSK